MSAGSRSLVNCTRCQASPSTCASACASVVLPTPGTSSISRWPRASRQARHSRICAGLPRMIVSSASQRAREARSSARGAHQGAHGVSICARARAARSGSPLALLELARRARAPWRTTSGGALRTKFSLRELGLRLARAPARVFSSACRGAPASAAGIDQACHRHQQRQRRRRAPSPTAGAVAPAASSVTLSRPASRSSSAPVALREAPHPRRWRPCSSTRCACAGLMSISPRIWRTPRMTPAIQADLALGRRVGGNSAALRPGREHDGRAPARRPSGATRCQISSVMNGMSGCSARCSASSTSSSVRAGAALGGAARRLGLQHRLGELEVPVAELVPGELVERARGEVEAVVARTPPRPASSMRPKRERIQRSATRELPRRPRCGAARLGHQRHEARRIPQLVAEVAVAGDARQVEADVAARRGERREGEAQRIGAVRRDAVPGTACASPSRSPGASCGCMRPRGALGDAAPRARCHRRCRAGR